MANWNRVLVVGIGGMFVGAIFAVVLIGIVLLININNNGTGTVPPTETRLGIISTPYLYDTPSPTLEPTKGVSPQVTEVGSRQPPKIGVATFTPTHPPNQEELVATLEVVDAVLREAEMMLGKDPQGAIDLVAAIIDAITHKNEIIRALTIMGQAEAQLGHLQLAAAHYEHIYRLELTFDTLLVLAFLYDQSGNQERAIEKYQEIASWPDEEADDYRDWVLARVDILIDVVGTPTPTP